jgi:hypothetical protein
MPREEPGGTWENLRAHGTWRSDDPFLHMKILLLFVFCDIVGKKASESAIADDQVVCIYVVC